MTNVHVVKKLFIQQKNFLHAVLHGTKVVSNAKHVRIFQFHSFIVNSSFLIDNRQQRFDFGFIQGLSTRCLLQRYIEIITNHHIFIIDLLYFLLGCYQDKLHPHERNRKQLEGKFSKQPAGGNTAAAAAQAAPEAAAEEE